MRFEQELIQKIAAAHGISGDARLMPASGMVNEAWLLDERFVLRITLDNEAFDEAPREAWIVPIVRKAGVLSPELMVCDESKELIDRPYTIYRKAEGVLLGEIEEDPDLFVPAYRELGHQFSKVQSIPLDEAERSKLRGPTKFDVEKQFHKTKDAGLLSDEDAEIVESCMNEMLAEIVEPDRLTLVHHDVHPWNMFVDPTTRELTAIIDWGDAAWGEPAEEFVSMPIQALPHMLAGYKEAGQEIGRGQLVRLLCLGLALCLWEVRDLQPERFKRQWWRHSPKGFGEDVRMIRELLG